MAASKKRVIVGVDEAGRGPLVGPMVIAVVAFEAESLERLAALGVRDSKKLTPRQRERLYEEILSASRYAVIIRVPPALIDSMNLNELEENEIVFGLRRIIEAGLEPSKIYIDAVGRPERLVARLHLRLRLPSEVFTVEERADERYPAVSAASIIAKVVRDREIERLRKLYGFRGSGYPTDPETIEWIKSEYLRNPRNPPDFVRRSWATLKDIAPGWYLDKKKLAAAAGHRSLLDFLKGRRG